MFRIRKDLLKTSFKVHFGKNIFTHTIKHFITSGQGIIFLISDSVPSSPQQLLHVHLFFQGQYLGAIWRYILSYYLPFKQILHQFIVSFGHFWIIMKICFVRWFPTLFHKILLISIALWRWSRRYIIFKKYIILLQNVFQSFVCFMFSLTKSMKIIIRSELKIIKNAPKLSSWFFWGFLLRG